MMAVFLPGLAQTARSVDSATTARPVPVLSFLLPAEGDVVHAPRTKIVVRASGAVPEGLLAVLDGVWLEEPVQVSKDLLTLELSGLSEGVHAVRLMYLDEKDRIRSTATVRFFVRLPEPPPPPPPTLSPKLKQSGRIAARVEWRNEEAATRVYSHAELEGLGTVAETDSTYAYDTLMAGRAEKPFSRQVNATVEGSYSARYELWEADVKASASTQENRFRQPVNRFSASTAYGPWARVSVGDLYPDYNPLIFNGTRVRGAEAGAALVMGEENTRWAYARVTTGETQRSVPAYIIRSRFGGGYDTAYVPGTRGQHLTALRVGTGGSDAFDAGITLMKSSAAKEDSVAEAVNEYLYGYAPSENLVTGLDARIGFWGGKVEVYGRGAFSLYTRDRSLGAFAGDSAASFDPTRYRRILVINPTTSGWEYLITDGGGEPDYTGLFHASSTYETGVTTSIPWRGVSWETGIGYSHLGAAYHSEGNPFLGGNPGSGWNIQQRVGLFENRLHLGAEASRFLQDFGDYRQLDRALRAEVRYTTLEARSTAWINGGVTRQVPQGSATYSYRQDFDEANLGGSHQHPGSAGTWNLFTQYGFTRGHFRIVDPGPDDPIYPVSVTHAITSSVLYKFRNSDFIPKVSHTYADNGVQRPAHGLGLGAQQLLMEKRIKLDGNVLVGQYAKTTTRNGISFGQNVSATLHLRDRESLRLTERASWMGERVSVIAGTNYERSF